VTQRTQRGGGVRAIRSRVPHQLHGGRVTELVPHIPPNPPLPTSLPFARRTPSALPPTESPHNGGANNGCC